MGNQFVIGVAAGDGPFVTERDYVAETGIEIRDNSNLAVCEIDLADHLTANPGKVIRIRLSDGQPADGWGPYLTRIAIVNQAGTGQGNFQTVLRSTDLFEGLDIRTEINKGYYTIDLDPIPQSDNPTRQVYVKFTDGSTADGWGPGLFWMAVHSGPIAIHSDCYVFEGLKAMNGDPQGFGLNLLHRRYALDSAKTLEQIVLPAQSTLESNIPYLLAATLNPATAEVRLIAELTPDHTLRLSWPASATDYRLQSADTLNGNWTDASEFPTLEGTHFVFTLQPAESRGYFRLRK